MCRADHQSLASTCATRARASSQPVDVARSLGEIRDQPRRDHRVVRRVGRIEQTLGGRVRVGVAAGGERGQHLAELRERHRDVRADRLRDHLGLGRQALGLLIVAAHRGDERDRGVGGGRQQRFRELLGETSRLLRPR